MAVKEKHPHYFKKVGHLDTIDTYRVCERFGITNPALAHAVKKLLVAGGRGAGKDIVQDVQEAIDSLERFKEMREEDYAEQFVTVTSVSSVDRTTAKQKARTMPKAVKRELAERRSDRVDRRKVAAQRPARRAR